MPLQVQETHQASETWTGTVQVCGQLLGLQHLMLSSSIARNKQPKRHSSLSCSQAPSTQHSRMMSTPHGALGSAASAHRVQDPLGKSPHAPQQSIELPDSRPAFPVPKFAALLENPREGIPRRSPAQGLNLLSQVLGPLLSLLQLTLTLVLCRFGLLQPLTGLLNLVLQGLHPAVCSRLSRFACAVIVGSEMS